MCNSSDLAAEQSIVQSPSKRFVLGFENWASIFPEWPFGRLSCWSHYAVNFKNGQSFLRDYVEPSGALSKWVDDSPVTSHLQTASRERERERAHSSALSRCSHLLFICLSSDGRSEYHNLNNPPTSMMLYRGVQTSNLWHRERPKGLFGLTAATVMRQIDKFQMRP